MNSTLFTFLLLLFSYLANSQKFTPLGNGLTLNGRINCITFDESNDRLYVGGLFDNIDQVDANNIAYLQDGQWYAIPNNIVGQVSDIEIHDNQLYVSGNFEIAGPDPIYDIVRYDGQAWYGFGKEQEANNVTDMVWHNDILYIAGALFSIDGVTHNGVTKMDERGWSDTGLKNTDKPSNLFVQGDTLWAWGQVQNTEPNSIHTASYHVNGEWHTLPSLLNSDRGVVNSLVMYDNKMYCGYSEGGIYILENDRWIQKSELEIEKLFVQNGKLKCATKYDRIASILEIISLDSDLTIISTDFTLKEYNGDHEPIINVIKEQAGDLYIGGDFMTIDDEYYPSLAQFSENKFKNIGNVRGTFFKSYWSYPIVESICEYKDGYAIAGSFYYADSLFNPNVVFWDGEKFTDAIKDLSQEIHKMIAYDGKLYAIGYRNWKDYRNAPVIQWDGTTWRPFYRTLIENLIDNMKVIDDKLILWNDSEDPFTWDGTQLGIYDLPPDTISIFDNKELVDIVKWNENTVVVMEDWPSPKMSYIKKDGYTEWHLLSDKEFDNYYGPVLSVTDERLFCSEEIGSDVVSYEWKDTSWVQLNMDEEGSSPGTFYSMNNLNFYSSFNDGMRLEKNGFWERKNHLRIFAAEQLPDNKYLCGGIFSTDYDIIDPKKINNIAIVDFSEPLAKIKSDKSNICPNEYVTYNVDNDYVGTDYSWHFPGGIPEYTNASKPIIKYKTPGIYNASLEIEYYDGSVVVEAESITVNDDCETESYYNHDNIWIMGYHYISDFVAGLDFSNRNIDTVAFASKIEMTRGSVSMCDKNGDLQFYTNGLSIMSKDHDTLYNSTNFNPSPRADYVGLQDLSIPQCILSLPQPGHDSLYYLTHLNYESYDPALTSLSVGWRYSTIDMREQDGKGAMIDKGITLTSDTMMYSTMQAAPHCNGTDWWIVCAKAYSDLYYRALLTEEGIELIDSFSIGIVLSDYINGQSVFSPDGNKYCLVNSQNNKVYLWDFDRCTGTLHNPQVIDYELQDDTDIVYGCAFSPNSRFIYLSSYLYYRQLDICKLETDDDPVTYVEEWDGRYMWIYPVSFATQRLTPNNKIIVSSRASSRLLSTVHNPDGYGESCDFRQHDIELREWTYNYRATLPEYPHYRIQETYSNCDTTIVTNVEYENLKTQLKVYPNPVNSMITFDAAPSSFGDNTVIKVYDINGRLMHDIDVSNSPSFTLNMGTYTAGLYPYSVTQRGQVIYENKIVKID